MVYAYRLTAKDNYYGKVPKGLVIECISEWGPHMGGPDRKSICRVLNMMGIDVKENDSCCHFCFWDWVQLR